MAYIDSANFKEFYLVVALLIQFRGHAIRVPEDSLCPAQWPYVALKDSQNVILTYY